jgi:signal transduction histidine kinase
MRLLSSLTNRIFLASALLAILTIALAMYLVSARVTREAEVELERGLLQSGELVAEHRRALSHDFLLLARLVADLPKFKAAVETQDAPTVRPVAEDYRRQLDADLLLVTDNRGALLFGDYNGAVPGALPAVTEALKGREAAAFWPHPHGILEVVTVPIAVGRDIPDVLGTLSAGFLLDDRRAQQFKRATASEIAFAAEGRIRGATLPAAVRGTLAQHAQTGGISRLLLGDEEFMMTAVPLSLPFRVDTRAADEPRVLVLRSRAGQLRSLRAIRITLLGTAALAVMLATVVSYLVSRSVTRPLGAITAAMRDMAATGDLTRHIALRGPAWWQDEDALLLASTFNTLIDSIARFQRETAQRERLLSLGRLSTVVAHEVRNPLMIIKAALRSLGPETPGPELREAAGDIDEQVNRLNRIVNDVLDFARPLRFELGPVDMAQLCRDAAAAVSAGEATGGMIAVVATPAPLVTDAERLRSALVNVLANAVEAVRAARAAAPAPPAPGGDIVMTAVAAPGGGARITVRDHGKGIDPEHAGHIFEPYFTTRRTGTGLGLPITRNIIEGLGGTIVVRRENPGTTVEITLPLAAGETPSVMIDNEE